jgi:hypothetical protein
MTATNDGKINEITLQFLGNWPSFGAQSWACKVYHAVQREVGIDLGTIPDGWFLYGLFNNHTPIRFRGEVHVECSAEGHGMEPWSAKLQRIQGGLLTEGTGKTPRLALQSAVMQVEAHLWGEKEAKNETT